MGREFTVAKKEDISEGQGISVEVDGDKVAIFNVDGEFFAISDECSHAGGSLSEGELNAHTVTCPLHGAEFDVKTGQALSEPAEENIKNYKVSVDEEDIKIEI